MKTVAILVAAGRGERAGADMPKQLRQLGGRTLVEWSLSAFQRHPRIEATVLVVPPGDESDYSARFPTADACVAGGETRAQSVRAGLSAAAAFTGMTHVLIHDAARPGLDGAVIDDLLDALEEHDGAAPALPVVDALKRKTDSGVETVPRSDLYRVQTPQAFRLDLIRDALDRMYDDLVDDLAAVERMGAAIRLTAGSERLAKVTYAEDFSRMAQLLITATPRIGTGFDVHAFGPGEAITLCGVTIPHDRGLQGHSDADVAWHALTDAILGAMALGDIGDHFPPSDPQWRGAPSHLFLKAAADLAAERGYVLSNCDLTLICEAPKIKPRRADMRQRTAELLGLELGAVSVKATTTEQLGFTGRGEGIAAQAVAVLSPTGFRD